MDDHVTLDRATDRGRTNLPGNGECPLDEGTALPHACVLLLFSFTPDDALTHAGASVSGAWTDDSTFVMETTLRVTADESNPDLPVKFGLNEEDFLQIGSTANIYTSGLKSNGTQYCDAQFSLSQCTRMTTLPNPNVPRLVSFSVRDADNLDAVLSVGDEYVLTFDVPTDQHRCDPACSGGKDFVLRLFAFSAPLASDYTGAWADNSTFVITVTRVDEGFVAPRLDATIAALRPPNAELTLLSADDLQPWLAQSGVDYIDLQSGLVPDRLPLRTADGLSLFAITACAALRLDYCDHEETGDRHVPMLKGSFGVLAAPSIVSFVADDPRGRRALARSPRPSPIDPPSPPSPLITLRAPPLPLPPPPTPLFLLTHSGRHGRGVLGWRHAHDHDERGPPTACCLRATSGGRTFVDRLFVFSASLGTDYSGAWRDESTFAIRILDTANAGTPTMSGPCSLHNVSLAVFPEDYCIFNRLVLAPPPPPLPPGSTGTPPPPPAHPTFAPAYTGWPPPVYVFFNASANLRSVAGRSQFTREPTALSGSFGTSLPPALISASRRLRQPRPDLLAGRHADRDL